MNIGKRTSNSV